MEDLYAFRADYRLVGPDKGVKVIECPAGYIAIYAHYLDFGMCFPLDMTLVKILKAFNVCLA